MPINAPCRITLAAHQQTPLPATVTPMPLFCPCHHAAASELCYRRRHVIRHITPLCLRHATRAYFAAAVFSHRFHHARCRLFSPRRRSCAPTIAGAALCRPPYLSPCRYVCFADSNAHDAADVAAVDIRCAAAICRATRHAHGGFRCQPPVEYVFSRYATRSACQAIAPLMPAMPSRF